MDDCVVRSEVDEPDSSECGGASRWYASQPLPPSSTPRDPSTPTLQPAYGSGSWPRGHGASDSPSHPGHCRWTKRTSAAVTPKPQNII